jgi:undecaprenyl diphosphate synthase
MTTPSASPDKPVGDRRGQLDAARLPRHVAVIMDGNGRWARQRGLPRLEGHRASRRSIHDTVVTCDDLGIEFLTLYTFSAENWQRPKAEVTALMALIEQRLRVEAPELHRKGVRMRLLGAREDLPLSLQDEIRRVEELTKDNGGVTLQLAINYGGRQEIVHAVRAVAAEAAAGRLSPDQIDESDIVRHLYLPNMPDPDLLIRTGGESRLSNYLLWQMAYAEIYVTAVLWPDFRAQHLCEALIDYQGRKRRFGGVEHVA